MLEDKEGSVTFQWENENVEGSEKKNRPRTMEMYKEDTNWFKNLIFFFFDVILNALIIVGLVIIIRAYLISPFRVYGPSMCDSLNYIDSQCVQGNGEYIIVNKIMYRKFGDFQLSAPKRGDIIVFHPPHSENEYYIKRIIGLPGDKIEIRDGFLYLFNSENPDGLKIEELYLNETNSGNTFVYNNAGTAVYEVPEGMFFLLGDNRIKSSDSRSCFSSEGCLAGFSNYLPFENIEGKAWISLWPLDLARFL